MSHLFDRYSAFTDIEALKEFSSKPLRKCLRVNTLKSSVDAFTSYAKDQGWKIKQVPWCTEGFFIDRDDRDRALGKDLLHLLGHTYMQEASSMLPVELLDPQPGESILDMAAAPGSKTTQIGAKMNGDGVLVANDMQETRLWTLKSAIHRSGVLNIIITKKVGQWFAKHMTERFDRVLCDAPCTAQGTIRKDPDALDYCSDRSISKASKLQFELLEAAVHACKVGGRIVYSTCTLTPEENEQVVAAILNKFCDQLECIDPRKLALNRAGWNVEKAIEDSVKVQNGAGEYPFLRIWPQTYDTEGFFCAVVQKSAPTKDVQHMEERPFREQAVSKPEQKHFAEFLNSRYGIPFIEKGERLYSLGDHLHITTEEVAKFFLPVTPFAIGIPFGRKLMKSPVYISHEMALLRGHQATDNIAVLDDEQFSQLMSGEDCSCNEELLGHVLAHYRGQCIGRGRARNGKLKNHIPRNVVRVASE